MKGNNAEDLILVSSYQKGDESALLKLLKKYDPLLKKRAESIGCMDFEDAEQELIAEFIRVVKCFDRHKEVYFSFYIKQRMCWRQEKLNREWIPIYENEVAEETIGEEIIHMEEIKKNEKELVKEIESTIPLTRNEKILLLAIAFDEPIEITRQTLGWSRATYYRKKSIFLNKLKRKGEEIKKILRV